MNFRELVQEAARPLVEEDTDFSQWMAGVDVFLHNAIPRIGKHEDRLVVGIQFNGSRKKSEHQIAWSLVHGKVRAPTSLLYVGESGKMDGSSRSFYTIDFKVKPGHGVPPAPAESGPEQEKARWSALRDVLAHDAVNIQQAVTRLLIASGFQSNPYFSRHGIYPTYG